MLARSSDAAPAGGGARWPQPARFFLRNAGDIRVVMSGSHLVVDRTRLVTDGGEFKLAGELRDDVVSAEVGRFAEPRAAAAVPDRPAGEPGRSGRPGGPHRRHAPAAPGRGRAGGGPPDHRAAARRDAGAVDPVRHGEAEPHRAGHPQSGGRGRRRPLADRRRRQLRQLATGVGAQPEPGRRGQRRPDRGAGRRGDLRGQWRGPGPGPAGGDPSQPAGGGQPGAGWAQLPAARAGPGHRRRARHASSCATTASTGRTCRPGWTARAPGDRRRRRARAGSACGGWPRRRRSGRCASPSSGRAAVAPGLGLGRAGRPGAGPGAGRAIPSGASARAARCWWPRAGTCRTSRSARWSSAPNINESAVAPFYEGKPLLENLAPGPAGAHRGRQLHGAEQPGARAAHDLRSAGAAARCPSRASPATCGPPTGGSASSGCAASSPWSPTSTTSPSWTPSRSPRARPRS